MLTAGGRVMRNGGLLIAGIVACAYVGATAAADAASDPQTRLWLWKSRAMFAFANDHDRYLLPTQVTMLDHDRRSVARFRVHFTVLEKQTLKPATDGVLSAQWTVAIPNLMDRAVSPSHFNWAAPASSMCGFTNIPCRFVNLMADGFSWGQLLVPTRMATLGAYRSCPPQQAIHFKAYDLTYDRFLQHSRVGIRRSLMAFPLTPSLTNQQIRDCVERRRMEPF